MVIRIKWGPNADTFGLLARMVWTAIEQNQNPVPEAGLDSVMVDSEAGPVPVLMEPWEKALKASVDAHEGLPTYEDLDDYLVESLVDLASEFIVPSSDDDEGEEESGGDGRSV